MTKFDCNTKIRSKIRRNSLVNMWDLGGGGGGGEKGGDNYI